MGKSGLGRTESAPRGGTGSAGRPHSEDIRGLPANRGQRNSCPAAGPNPNTMTHVTTSCRATPPSYVLIPAVDQPRRRHRTHTPATKTQLETTIMMVRASSQARRPHRGWSAKSRRAPPATHLPIQPLKWGGSKRRRLHPKAEALSTTSELDGQVVVPGEEVEEVVQECSDETKHVGAFLFGAGLLLSGGSISIIDLPQPETQAKSVNPQKHLNTFDPTLIKIA